MNQSVHDNSNVIDSSQDCSLSLTGKVIFIVIKRRKTFTFMLFAHITFIPLHMHVNIKYINT